MKLNLLFLSLIFSLGSFRTFAQPHAEFLMSAGEGCVNDVVSFINLSFGGVVSYEWDFDDGNTSVLVSPTHVFSDTGTYTVTLTVTDGDGLTDTWTEDYIVRPPVADFVLVPAIGCAIPHTVFFTDQSTLPDTWFWDFGDGNTSTLQNPVHNYTTQGEFVVTLTVTDTIFGCSDTHTDTVRVSIPTAVVDGGFGYFGCGPLLVDFEESSVPGAIGTLVSWEWDFGDGTTSDEMEPSHLYSDPGVYTVSLTVTNSLGCTSTDVNPFFVQVIGPDVNFGADVFFSECPPLTVNFTDSTFFGAPIISWGWDFGDGGTSPLQNPTYTYTDYGSYDVSLTIIDIDGCSRTLTFEDYIQVLDTIPPVFDVCPGDQVSALSATCDFELLDYTGLAAVSDNCTDPLVITQSPAPGTIITSDQVITLSTIDDRDSVATCTFNVLLFDDIDPTIICPEDQNVSFDSDCEFTLPDYTGLAVGADNCLPPLISQSPVVGTVITSTQTITLTATDTAGNSATCTFDVIPADDTAPTITCPGDITVDNDPGECGATVAYATPSGIDNCTSTTDLTAGLASGSLFPVGTTTNTYVVTDGVGLTATCSFDITVIDVELPSITCPGDISQDNDPGLCEATVSFADPALVDNCPGATFTQTGGLTSGSDFPVGTTVNTYEVTDASGNTATCSFNITVVDAELPSITCPDSVETCEAVVYYDDPVYSDNCGVADFYLAGGLTSGSEFPVGSTSVQYIVTDEVGNENICSFLVTRFPIPAIIAQEEHTINAGDSALLEVTAPLAETFSWSPPDGLDDPTIHNPKASPFMTTTYTVTVTTPEGCENEKDIIVNINEQILVTNFMSPNGDGKNDTWIIKGNFLLDDCQIEIYDSWGNRIYESTGYANDWDGTTSGGENLPQGNYYYVISCSGDEPLTGSITLIR